MDFVELKINEVPALAPQYNELAEFWRKKLWYQMSMKLLELSNGVSEASQAFAEGGALLALHKGFVARFQDHLNPFNFALFSVCASKQADATEAIEFLNGVASIDNVKGDEQALLLVELEIVELKLSMGKIEEGKAELVIAEEKIAAIQRVLPEQVHSKFHFVTSQYYKAVQNSSKFFSHSILYLTYTPLDNIPQAEQLKLATEVGISALLGDAVYNFGELLQHPILKKVDTLPAFAPLLEVLLTFNEGDMTKFASLQNNLPHEDLQDKTEFLNQKIRIMRLMELVFNKPVKSRTLGFNTIAEACDVKLDQVELLIMKAFSLNVITGLMDEVAQNVAVTWVQPRVLGPKQIQALSRQVAAWSVIVKDAAQHVEAQSPELTQYART
jgi:26S proteasome regulatory subunit N9